jgi:hypothetical protein
MIDPWSRPRRFWLCQFLAREQACPSISPTSAESGTPVRPRLIERFNKRVRVSAGGTPAKFIRL